MLIFDWRFDSGGVSFRVADLSRSVISILTLLPLDRKVFFRYEQYENDNLFKPKPDKTLQSVVPNVNLTIFKRRT